MVLQPLLLEIFKTWLDRALNNLVSIIFWPCCEEKFGWKTSWGMFHHELFHNIMILLRSKCHYSRKRFKFTHFYGLTLSKVEKKYILQKNSAKETNKYTPTKLYFKYHSNIVQKRILWLNWEMCWIICIHTTQILIYIYGDLCVYMHTEIFSHAIRLFSLFSLIFPIHFT